MSAREPIWILCEGSNTHPLHHLCPMCGVPLAELDADYDLIPEHKRRDIIAELKRGDFDRPRRGWS